MAIIVEEAINNQYTLKSTLLQSPLMFLNGFFCAGCNNSNAEMRRFTVI